VPFNIRTLTHTALGRVELSERGRRREKRDSISSGVTEHGRRKKLQFVRAEKKRKGGRMDDGGRSSKSVIAA